MTNDNARRDDAPAPCSVPLCRLSLALGVLIAAVLQFAAAAKVAHGADVLRRMKDAALQKQAGMRTSFNPADYQFLVQPSEAFKGGVPLDFVIAAAEFALVVLVLVAHRTRAVWLLVAIVFATFAGYGLQRLLNGQPCGCFGDLWHPPDGVTLALDVLFVAGALAIAGLRRTPRGLLIGAVVLSLAGAAGGYVYAQTTAPDARATSSVQPPKTPEARPASENADARQDQAPVDPAPAEGTAAERLLASDLMADVREAHASGDPTVYYVFIWDPTCVTCERYHPIVTYYQNEYAETGDVFLQILDFEKSELEARVGIPEHAWDSSPGVFLVKNGEVIEQPGGEDAPLPDAIHRKIQDGEPLTAE